MGSVHDAFNGDPTALQEAIDSADGGGPHTHPIADVDGLQSALDGKQPAGYYQLAGSYAAAVHDHDDRYYTDAETDVLLAAKLAATHAGTGGTAHANAVASGAAGFLTGADKAKLDGVASAATANAADAALRDRSTHTGTQSLDTTTDSATRLAMTAAERTKLAGVATGATANSADATLLARANHTGTQSLDTTTDSATRLAMTAAERTKLAGIATGATANSTDAALAAAYRTLLDSSGSHIAARVAGTYGFGQGDPLAISGTGTLYPLNLLYIDPADYPAIGALAAKLRLRCNLHCNDVAPTGNFTIGLHPVTRPASSGGAGLCTYTIGAAIAGSTIAINTPAADSSNNGVGADFAVPAAGFYVIGVVTTATVAASAHVHLSAALQMRYG